MPTITDPLVRLPGGEALPSVTEREHLDRVVIAGAGPTGLSAALALARLGVPVTVLEKGTELAEQSRASTLHPPTLELLDELGIIGPVLERGLKAPTTQFRDRRTGPVATFDLGVLAKETRYPFRVQLEQTKLTLMLAAELEAGKRAGKYDVDIRMLNRAHGVIAMTDSYVDVLIGNERGFQSMTAPWVVAADGAHSAIRTSLGIDLVGETYPEQFLVVSVADDLAALLPDLSYVNYVADPHEWLVLLRTPEHWRVLFPIIDSDPNESDSIPTASGQTMCARTNPLDPVQVQARLNTIVDLPRQWTVLDASLYVVARKVAATMRLGRVLLAGDAAHQNSPLGGMGMNSGIQDAVSCARRLAEVWHGGNDATLDRYDQLRRGVATEYVQADSHANWLVLREPDPQRREAMQCELREIAADPERHRARMRRTAMLDAIRESL